MEAQEKEGISIIVCCHNSSDVLDPTIKHLAGQDFSPDLKVELLIVDNNSSDGTAEMANSLWQSCGSPYPLKILHEEKPGLIYARETGFAHAQYDIICFVDDDNWLANDYIRLGYQVITGDSAIGILGGKGELVSSITPPGWLKEFENSYAVGAQAETSGDITYKKGYVYGAGMFMKAKVWNEVKATGFESQLTGRKGDEQTSGEEVEFSYIVKYLGYKIYYDERLTFQHYIKPSRLTWDYLIQRYKGIGASQFYLRAYQFYMHNDINPVHHLRLPVWLDRAIMVFHLLKNNKFKFILSYIQDTTGDKEVLQSYSYWKELKTYLKRRDELTHVYNEIHALKKGTVNNKPDESFGHHSSV